MLDGRRATEARVYRHEIESVLIVRSAVPQHPHTRNPGDIPLLPPAHRLEPTAAEIRPSGFYFYKGDQVSLPNDEIDVMPAQLEPVSLDRPATRCKVGHGRSLAFETQYLPLILPLGDRREASSA